jgi:hypothetical protein
VERTFDPLPVDDPVAASFAEIVADARRKRSNPRALDRLERPMVVANTVQDSAPESGIHTR